MTLTQALSVSEVIQAWEAPEVVYTFPNGWTIERVLTKNDKAQEGKLLGHCLGENISGVDGPNWRIFSLRDPAGVSHATITGVLAGKGNFGYFGEADLNTVEPFLVQGEFLTVVQVRGRLNTLARDEYLDMVMAWYLSGGGKPPVGTLNDTRYNRMWGKDEDDAYHEEGCWDGRTFRDVPGTGWHRPRTPTELWAN
jgi:hypothetical protein